MYVCVRKVYQLEKQNCISKLTLFAPPSFYLTHWGRHRNKALSKFVSLNVCT